jgi:hypothetical protein
VRISVPLQVVEVGEGGASCDQDPDADAGGGGVIGATLQANEWLFTSVVVFH